MKIIISPAKKMVEELDFLPSEGMPRFLERAEELATGLAALDYPTLKRLLGCNERLARLNFDRYAAMDLRVRLTPAVFAYEGIQYRYMAPRLFSNEQYGWLRDHLRILSGLYGLLRPFDGVVPYRLEMGAKWNAAGPGGLYAFWGGALAGALAEAGETVVDLASREYSRAVLPHLPAGTRVVTCVFGDWEDGTLREKGTLCKMARGEMVRYLAELGAEGPEAIPAFDRLGYRLDAALSAGDRLVFVRRGRRGRRT